MEGSASFYRLRSTIKIQSIKSVFVFINCKSNKIALPQKKCKEKVRQSN